MKKYYKLLLVLLIVFLINIIKVDAYTVEAGYGSDRNLFYDSKDPIGLNASYRISVSCETKQGCYGNDYKVTGYFNSTGEKEVSVVLNSAMNTFKITDDFTPNKEYELTRIKITGVDGEEYFSFVEDGTYKYVENSNNKIFIQKELPVYPSVNKFLIEGEKEYYSIYYTNNKGKFNVKFPTDGKNITDLKFTLYESDKDDNGIQITTKKINNDTYEVDLSSISSKLKESQSYSIKECSYIYEGVTYFLSTLSKYKNDSGVYYINYGPTIFIYKEILEEVKFSNNKVKLNEKIYFDIKTNTEPISGKLAIKNKKTGNVTKLTINDITKKPYVNIPYNLKTGEYAIDLLSITVKNPTIDTMKNLTYNYYDNKETYSDKSFYKYYEFNYNLTIEKDDGTIKAELLELDNDDITDETISDIKKINEGIEINVDASKNTKVKKVLFETIKGTDKTLNVSYKENIWSFKGKNISNPKDIDVKIKTSDASKNEDISKKVEDAVIVEFANNGELPGKSNIKLYNDLTIANIIKNKKINLYHYDEETKKFELVDTNIKLSKEGYYEIELSHNSKYVITPNEIETKYLVGSSDIPIVLIIIITVAILLVVGIVVLLVLKKKKNKKEEVKIEEAVNEVPLVDTDEVKEEPIKEE